MIHLFPADADLHRAIPTGAPAPSYPTDIESLEGELALTRAELRQALGDLRGLRGNAECQVAGLTPRQRQIMGAVLAGHPSKNIAADLGISRRTVENHRAAIMRKTGTRSLPALARLALAAEPAE
ncbi:LuxR C-terminal-related transcriptional regulator [Methylobacterium sp. BTF04]|uniref:LuxR C-terminal-related transcriptional regulator n=1 Tax=Methylobacterium sp. BTF04 TaxID=2708300 RepID=UPI002484C408|nr:LuxR C-terminal-related transcriptional regulator [Methylobacterium sp. BTF04]